MVNGTAEQYSSFIVGKVRKGYKINRKQWKKLQLESEF